MDTRQTQSVRRQEIPSIDFSDIYNEYQRSIYGYLLRLTENEAEAEDLTQETFIRAHRGLSNFRGESSLKTWLYRIASNIYLDYTRKSSTRKGKSTTTLDEKLVEYDHWADEESAKPEQIAEQSEMSSCVQDYIEALPDNYKTVLILHDEEGLKLCEIAEIIGCSENNAKIRLRRAREKLRTILNTACDFSRDERNVFICERKARENGCGGNDCSNGSN